MATAFDRLIIGDIHERIPAVERILAHYLPRVRAVTCLGDYFDTADRQTRRTVGWLTEALRDPRMELLLGNHDMQYLWPAATWFRCSGFSPATLTLLQDLPLDLRWKLQDPRGRIFTQHHGYLLSHAGLHAQHVPATEKVHPARWLREQEDAAYQRLKGSRSARPYSAREFFSPAGSWLWQVGQDRGGRAKVGGPVWLGWESFVDSPPLPPQIVGHSMQQLPAQKGRSWNLDTQLRYVGLLDAAGTLTVESTSGLV